MFSELGVQTRGILSASGEVSSIATEYDFQDISSYDHSIPSPKHDSVRCVASGASKEVLRGYVCWNPDISEKQNGEYYTYRNCFGCSWLVYIKV